MIQSKFFVSLLYVYSSFKSLRMITTKDKEQLKLKGISEASFEEQLNHFKTGFPYLKISAAASVEKGIVRPDEAQLAELEQEWQNYVEDGHTILKFVPASGAASRMFKNLFAFADGESDVPQTDFEKQFFEHLHDFAFFDDLDEACCKLKGAGADALVAAGKYKDVVNVLLRDGLHYGQLPKGLLKFHRYAKDARTPVEEQLVEGVYYGRENTGHVGVHFTVSPEHRKLFEQLVAEKAPELGNSMGVNFEVTFSEQKPSTDTVAVTPQNKPFRTEDGSLVFRPGGHGALIENLNDLDADVIFVKNIDNVMPDHSKDIMVRWKKILAGKLVQLQKQIFAYMRQLDSGQYSMDELLEMLQFLQKKLFCKNPETKFLEDTELAIYLRRKFNRPLRVCGMVRNVGEPGGGPFLAYNPDGTISLQILESSQIDMNDPEKKALFEKGTHFNPVDLVCATKDYKGNKFNLPDFVDKNAGFISSKSKDGKELKALELPGLWNGAMSDWNTVFVEVPLATFCPVKTVNDLLRSIHQLA